MLLETHMHIAQSIVPSVNSARISTYREATQLLLAYGINFNPL